ncbi:MAG: alkaline phosphatase D family protein [Thermomicrobiales bacterium]
MINSRADFEQMLKRRTNRRLAMKSGFAAGAAGLIGVSYRGGPTRAFARQAATPEATPVDLTDTPSARFGAYPFQLGVASGEPLPQGIVLWTRLAPAPLDGGGMDPIPYDLRWEVARDAEFGDVAQTGFAVADPNLAHSVHVDVTGLEPFTEYFYRFMVGDEVSQVGRTKTAPERGQAVDSLRFGFASCSNYEHGYFVAYRDMAEQRFDVNFHLGDYIYEYAANDYNVREPENIRLHNGGETVALQNYRNRFAQYHTDPDLQAVHQSAPMVVTWDDHEVDNNYADEIPENYDDVSDFLMRRADAYQAYYEHMPLRPWSLPVGPDMTLYRSLTFGDLMEVTVLDTRQYRDDQPSGDGTFPRTPASMNATMLGLDQERWLLDKLANSTATWNVMAQQVNFAEAYFPDPEQQVIDFYNDSWTGYPAARQRILQHIVDQQVANPVVLTGDIHTSWASDLKLNWADPDAPNIGSEYICTSITAGGLEPSTFLQGYEEGAEYIRFFDPNHGGYTAVEVTQDLWRSDFYLVDNMEQYDSGVSHLATWVTERDNPGVQEG